MRSHADEYTRWQQDVLRGQTVVCALLGIPFGIAFVIMHLVAGRELAALVATGTTLPLLLLLLPRLSHAVRLHVFLGIHVTGILIPSLAIGLIGTEAALYVSLIAHAMLFSGLRLAMAYGIPLLIVQVGLIGVSHVAGWMPVDVISIDARQWFSWWVVGLTSLVAGSVVGMSYWLLIRRMREALSTERFLSEELRRESAARGEALERLARAQDEMMRAERLKVVGELAGGLAHDLNNVLMAIMGEAELSEDERTRDAITTASVHAAGLTQRLLGLTRNRIAQRQPVFLETALRDMLVPIKRLLRSRLRVHTEWDSNGPVFADPVELQQVVFNLALNARDAMRDGGGNLYIQTRPSPDRDNHVRLTVRDDGPGMPPEIQARAFDAFFTTRDGRGSGLGLFNVRRIVIELGAELELDSKPGGGTTFHIDFPCCADEPSTDLTVGTPSGHGERLLVIEDDIAVRAALVGLLGRAGFQVVEARDAADAIRRLETEPGDPPALVITDVLMPGMSVTELARSIRERWSGVPLLLHSGFADANQLRSVLEMPLTRFLPKPSRREQLLRAIDSLIRASHPTQRTG